MRAVVRHACVMSALRHVRNDNSGSSSNGATECAALCSSRRPLVTHDGALRDVFRLPPPRVQSPLTPLRPPPPPSARDVLPFGSLNKTHRPRYYYNVNVVAATAPTTASAHHHHRNSGNNNNSGSCSVGGEATTAVTATPMDVARLTRNNNDRGRAATVAASNTDSNSNNSNSSPVLLAQNTPHVQQHQQQRLRAHTTHDTAATTPSHTHMTLADGHSVHGAAAATASQHPRKEQQQQQHRQTYEEHCIVGWSLSDFYRVVADVDSYSAFLPWCASSRVHTRRCVQANGAGSDDDDDAAAAARVEEMTATLTVGFSWLTESYTSRVTLVPGQSIVAVLHDERHGGSSDDDEKETNNNSNSSSGGGGGLLTSLLRKAVHTASAVARNSILQELCCEWRFAAQPDKPHEVEVRFVVSFTFSNPLYSRLIMSNIVAIMIRSFERRCEALYGPPSTPHRTLPAST